MKRTCLIMFLLGGLVLPSIFAQAPKRALPLSLNGLMADVLPAQVLLQPYRLAGLDMKRLHAEDALRPGTRFAAPVKVDFDLTSSGVWTGLPDGGAVWKLKLEAPVGSLGLIALYDELYLPPGSSLFMYSPDGKFVEGPVSPEQISPEGHFASGLVPGNTAIIEYYEPAASRGKGRVHIFRVDQAYHRENLKASGFDVGSVLGEELGFGTSGNCHPNITCPEGAVFEKEKRALCRVILVLEEGTGYCTGSLVNNARSDGRPLLISAFHCQDGYTPMYSFWRFDFNYESKECANPAEEPLLNSITGCRRLSGYQKTDFLLLELSRRLPGTFKTYFLGWNRMNVQPSGGAVIHHPRGDIKKLSLDRDPIPIFQDGIQWNNEVATPAGHHLRAQFDFGSFDIGSSGAPLLNQEGRYVGQLHGGSASCSGAIAYFGRMAVSWEGGGSPSSRLKDWLDPAGQNITVMDGFENPFNSGGEVAGMVTTETGDAIPGALVSLKSSNGFSTEGITDSVGKFSFSPIPYGSSFEVSVAKTDTPLNGLSVSDVVKLQKHILNVELLSSPFQWIAADVNASRSISTMDLIQIRKVILGVEVEFKSVPPWIFVPAEYEFSGSAGPFSGSVQIPQAIQVQNFVKDVLDLDFIGVKAGDVNNSANPNN